MPASDVPGEATWPTQPVPIKPAALSQVDYSCRRRERRSTDIVPEARKITAAILPTA